MLSNDRMGLGLPGLLRKQNFHASIVALIFLTISSLRTIRCSRGVQRNLTLKSPTQIPRHLCQSHLLIRKTCVAAHRRHNQTVEACTDGRVLFKTPICVPALRKDRRLLVCTSSQRDNRGSGANRHEERVIADRAKVLGYTNQIVVRKLLRWKSQYMVLQPHLPDFSDRL